MVSLIRIFIGTFLLCILDNITFGQKDGIIDKRKAGLDVFALGVGTGVDYGGLGLRMIS